MPTVERITVLGAGIMGHGIAQLAAMAGYTVALRDVDPDRLNHAVHLIEKSMEKFVARKRLSAEDAAAARERLTPVLDLAGAVERADFVVEAIPEDRALKRELFATLSDLCRPEALVVSNTSQFMISSLADAYRFPANVCGMHFFNPPVLMRLVEIARAAQSADATVETTVAIAQRMGKETVMCSDTPGFITTRLIALLSCEAGRMIDEGVATADDIDRACRLAFNHAMGPLETADYAGLDTVFRACSSLETTLGDRFSPTLSLRRLVAAGHLGCKSGSGYYDYAPDGSPISPTTSSSA